VDRESRSGERGSRGVDGAMLPLIVFALLLGLALVRS
jgi:hypothetical protein